MQRPVLPVFISIGPEVTQFTDTSEDVDFVHRFVCQDVRFLKNTCPDST